MFLRSFTFFAKECCVLCVLLRCLQKNVAFFSVLCIRTLRSLHSFPLFRKEREKTERSFGSHKSPKTRKRTEMNGTFFLKNGMYRMGKNAVPNPAVLISFTWKQNFLKAKLGHPMLGPDPGLGKFKAGFGSGINNSGSTTLLQN